MSALHDKALVPRYLTGLKHVPQIINIESVLRSIVTRCDSVLNWSKCFVGGEVKFQFIIIRIACFVIAVTERRNKL